MTEASCRHFWTTYRKGRQQVGNTHCTSLHVLHCGIFLAPCLPCFRGDNHRLDTGAPGEVLSHSHFVFLHQQSSMPLLLAVQPLFSSLPLSHLLQSSPFLTWSYHHYICYSNACLLFSSLSLLPQSGFFDDGVLMD